MNPVRDTVRNTLASSIRKKVRWELSSQSEWPLVPFNQVENLLWDNVRMPIENQVNRMASIIEEALEISEGIEDTEEDE